MLHHNTDRLNLARKLRREMTEGETILWNRLRRKAMGYSFRRQFPSGPYVLDFYCAVARLCVEIDGPQHAESLAQDAKRDLHFESLGIETLRIPSIEVFDNIDGVLDEIVRTCQSRTGWKPPES